MCFSDLYVICVINVIDWICIFWNLIDIDDFYSYILDISW